MRISPRILAPFLLLTTLALTAAPLRAGDAVAFDYTTGLGGIFYSSTPPDGKDYKDATEAIDFALLTAKQKGGKKPVIIHQSNLTGYFCLAVGFNEKGEFVAQVGLGETAEDAKADVLRSLRAAGATSKPNILHEYFSYGAPAKPADPAAAPGTEPKKP